MHSLNDLENLIGDIHAETKEEALSFIKTGEAHIRKLCSSNKEKKYCSEIINFWKDQYKDQYVTVYDPKTKTTKKKFQKGDYSQLCKNVMVLDKFKQMCPSLQMDYLAYIISETQGEDLQKHLKETFNEKIFPSYLLNDAKSGMHITNGDQTTLEPYQLKFNGKRTTLSKGHELVTEGKADHPKY